MAERLSVLAPPFACTTQVVPAAAHGFSAAYCGLCLADQVQLYFDEGDASQRLNIEAVLADALPDTHLYVCGPQGFIDAVLDAARQQRWSEKRLHWEFFAAANVGPRGEDTAFEVQLASSGRVVSVAVGQSVTQALQDVACGDHGFLRAGGFAALA
jgi:vanillate O-demethylase ferredoxin subunit